MEVVVSSPTVLLLEHDITVRYPLAEYLRECGYKVFEARAAEDAAELLDACVSGIGAAVLNLRALGDANAFDIAHRIRAQHADAIVVVIGTTDSASDRVAALLCDRSVSVARGAQAANPRPHAAPRPKAGA